MNKINKMEFKKKQALIFFLLIPYFIIGKIIIFILSIMIANSLEHYDIPFTYLQSILFSAPVIFYLYFIYKNLKQKYLLRASFLSLPLIFLLVLYYFTGKYYNKDIYITNQEEYLSHKHFFLESYIPYFLPWITANKINYLYLRPITPLKNIKKEQKIFTKEDIENQKEIDKFLNESKEN